MNKYCMKASRLGETQSGGGLTNILGRYVCRMTQNCDP